MNGSYAQHSSDTVEYQQGRNSAEWNLATPYGVAINNPYSSDTKQWIDWQIGYESFKRDIDVKLDLKRTIEETLITAEIALNQYKELFI